MDIGGGVNGAADKFIDNAVKDRKPFFVWFNTTRMHVWTHLKKESDGRTGIGLYPDGMVEHDDMVGELLKKLDDMGLAENTIVVYGTDNGAETGTWPDGGITPFHGEKGGTWEGGMRVPMVVRWPGVIKPGTEINDIFSQEDWSVCDYYLLVLRSLPSSRTEGPSNSRNLIIMSERKSAEELAAMVKKEARKIGKCYNLIGGSVAPSGHPGDWDFKPMWSGTGLSSECQNGLTSIIVELKKQYQLK